MVDRVLEIPPSEKITPVCRHFPACGGCAFQDASDRFLADWKSERVQKALSARGLAAPVRAISTSPPQSRRRATYSGRRTKKTAIVGFHARSSGEIVPFEECHLVRPEITAARLVLRELARLGATRKGEVRLSVTVYENGLDIDVSDAKSADGPLLVELANIAAAHDLARLSWNGDTVAIRRTPALHFGGAMVRPPPSAFLQATEEGEAALVAAVKEAVGDARRIADLFSGCGTFSLPLAVIAEVHAAESDAAMLAALDAGWRSAEGLKTVTFEKRDLFRRPLLGPELSGFDAAVIDPPRAGAQAQTRELAASPLRRIAAVSCNPATFARDAQVLCDSGFQIDWIEIIDQFRWSEHVELVAQLSRDL